MELKDHVRAVLVLQSRDIKWDSPKEIVEKVTEEITQAIATAKSSGNFEKLTESVFLVVLLSLPEEGCVIPPQLVAFINYMFTECPNIQPLLIEELRECEMDPELVSELEKCLLESQGAH